LTTFEHRVHMFEIGQLPVGERGLGSAQCPPVPVRTSSETPKLTRVTPSTSRVVAQRAATPPRPRTPTSASWTSCGRSRTPGGDGARRSDRAGVPPSRGMGRAATSWWHQVGPGLDADRVFGSPTMPMNVAGRPPPRPPSDSRAARSSARLLIRRRRRHSYARTSRPCLSR
jgi:hypothetical protein